MHKPTGHLRLKQLVFWGRHGYLPFERDAGNRFEVDVDLETDLSAVIRSDRIEDTADLAAVYEIVRRHVEGEPCALIETLADRIAVELAQSLNVKAVTVSVRKMFPPLPGAVGGITEAEVSRVP